uniref:Methyltransferase type 11 domain-containing protein n=1 Tax=viral metagenome TaxID=1070528 RepID=A0A6C0I4C6_9ZZZZ
MLYIFTSSNPEIIFLKWLLLLAVCFVAIVFYKQRTTTDLPEAFSQDKPFVLKRDGECFDNFYAEVYDGLWEREKMGKRELEELIKATEPSKSKSVFLDVGSGTGYMVNELLQAGYRAYGIDQSKAMVEYANATFPNTEMRCDSVLDPMAFENGTFSHILCTHFTIYHMNKKDLFFQNCYNWLKPNGYLLIHLVDRTSFDTIVPAGKPTFLKSPQQYADKRITDTTIDFDNFRYQSSYQFNDDAYGRDKVILKETFTDKTSNNVRQNEMTLYMEEEKTVLAMAHSAGFIQKSKMSMSKVVANGDLHQYLYLLERI